MSITRFFERLGAPLVNNRWSWGGRRASDGTVFLRVWQDLKYFENGERYMLLDGGVREDRRNPGYQERLKHIEAVRRGAPCFLVMCIARDVAERPRVIQDFHDEDVFVGGELAERNGEVWIRVAGRKPIGEVGARANHGSSHGSE